MKSFSLMINENWEDKFKNKQEKAKKLGETVKIFNKNLRNV